MKKIAYWALLNPWKSQSILVLCHLMLAVVAIYGGVLLFAHDILLPKALIYVGEALFFVLLIGYPVRRARYRFWKTNYVKQKAMDAGFVLSYLLMAVTLTNESAKIVWNDTSDTPTAGFIAMKENVRPTVAAAPKANVLSKKAVRQQFKTWVMSMKANAANDDGSSLKIIGTLLLMLAGIFLVAIFSCSLICSEASALGYFLLFAGWGLILYFGIQGIRKILLKRKANYQPTPKE